MTSFIKTLPLYHQNLHDKFHRSCNLPDSLRWMTDSDDRIVFFEKSKTSAYFADKENFIMLMWYNNRPTIKLELHVVNSTDYLNFKTIVNIEDMLTGQSTKESANNRNELISLLHSKGISFPAF